MWNYRLCKKTHRTNTTKPEEITCVSYEIHEAYYNDDGGLWAVTESPVTIGAYLEPEDGGSEEDMLAEVKGTVGRMNMALYKGVIDLDTVKFVDCDADDDGDFVEGLVDVDEDGEYLVTDDEFIELDIEEDSEDN